MIRIEKTEKYTRYYKNDEFHREDGPAIEWSNGYKEYYINGKRHREDGPAVEWVNGYKEYWYNGEKIEVNSTEEFIRMIDLIILW